jgi:hypothetical protein
VKESLVLFAKLAFVNAVAATVGPHCKRESVVVPLTIVVVAIVLLAENVTASVLTKVCS